MLLYLIVKEAKQRGLNLYYNIKIIHLNTTGIFQQSPMVQLLQIQNHQQEKLTSPHLLKPLALLQEQKVS